jgi:hypothetical protein
MAVHPRHPDIAHSFRWPGRPSRNRVVLHGRREGPDQFKSVISAEREERRDQGAFVFLRRIMVIDLIPSHWEHIAHDKTHHS